MILEKKQISELAKADTDSAIVNMRSESNDLIMHYFGDRDLQDTFLQKVEDFENSRQLELRHKLAISNEFLTQDLLRPVDNVWSAKGGSREIGLDGEAKVDFAKILLNVSQKDKTKEGYSIRKYMQDIWSERFVVDPNGLLFVENNENDAYITYKSIYKIKNYMISGYVPEYVVFEPHEIIEEGEKENKTVKKRLWIVDDAFYYLIQIEGDSTRQLKKIPNIYGVVPAVINSGLTNTKKQYRESPISKQIDLLNSYLTKNSRKEVYQNFHDYPIFWQYEIVCPSCNGTKKLSDKVCDTCKGTGFASSKDVSKVMTLTKPGIEDAGIAPPPAGYISVETDSIEGQRVELDWIFDKAFFSLWGATREKAENETATGRFIDVQPVNNKLSIISDIAQVVETILIDLLGKFYYNATYDKSTVIYGKRYLIETPDQIWNKYIGAKKDKAPYSSLNLLINQYYEAEFQNDPKSFAYYAKLVGIEPFFHDDTKDVMSWPISEDQKAEKIYYNQWLKTKTRDEVIETETEQLKAELKEYTSQFININIE